MGWSIDPVEQSVLYHYIERFEPHVPRTNPNADPAVWAIDAARAALYWFPRDCPRVAVWANNAVQGRHLAQLFKTTASRVQAVPQSWSDQIGACTLYEYRLDAAGFRPWPEAEGQWVSHETVRPLAVEPVGDLVARHRAASVELRLELDLGRIREAVLNSGLPFSIVRYA
jgi:hypothetical protein